MTRIGVLGGGQLGRMLGLAGVPLGASFSFFEPAPAAPARAAGRVTCAAYSPGATDAFAEDVDVVTFESENVPPDLLGPLTLSKLTPGPTSLSVSRDRHSEKTFLTGLGAPVAEWTCLEPGREGREAVLAAAAARLGLPFLVKSRTGGFDGRGQVRVVGLPVSDPALDSLLARPCVAETVVRFDRECSVVAVRGTDGEIVTYPAAENVHVGGILDRSRPFLPADGPAAREATRVTRLVAEALGHVGCLAVEFFVIGDEVVANEIAPRVHNSGHWTVDAAETSQFENHVRAVCGLPLGGAETIRPFVMKNLVGSHPAVRDLLAVPGAKVHLYGKEPRPGRKVGHVTVTGATEAEAEARFERLEALFAPSSTAQSMRPRGSGT